MGVDFSQEENDRYIVVTVVVISQAFYGRTESGSHGLRAVGVYN